MMEERERIVNENKDFFERTKKVKDSYDVEYDKGKLKKVKKKKKYITKNNFQKAYEYFSRKRRR